MAAPAAPPSPSLAAFLVAIANSDLAGICNLLRVKRPEEWHSSAPRQQPEQLLVNTLKFRLWRAALQPTAVARSKGPR